MVESDKSATNRASYQRHVVSMARRNTLTLELPEHQHHWHSFIRAKDRGIKSATKIGIQFTHSVQCSDKNGLHQDGVEQYDVQYDRDQAAGVLAPTTILSSDYFMHALILIRKTPPLLSSYQTRNASLASVCSN